MSNVQNIIISRLITKLLRYPVHKLKFPSMNHEDVWERREFTLSLHSGCEDNQVRRGVPYFNAVTALLHEGQWYSNTSIPENWSTHSVNSTVS
jgi:hypothetical protein